MQIVMSRNNVPVRLTEERWRHIVSRHPEMHGQRERVLETVQRPEIVQEGDLGVILGARYYSETPLTSKFLVAAYRELSVEDGFVLTAYFTTRLSPKRVILWKQ